MEEKVTITKDTITQIKHNASPLSTSSKQEYTHFKTAFTSAIMAQKRPSEKVQELATQPSKRSQNKHVSTPSHSSVPSVKSEEYTKTTIKPRSTHHHHSRSASKTNPSSPIKTSTKTRSYAKPVSNTTTRFSSLRSTPAFAPVRSPCMSDVKVTNTYHQIKDPTARTIDLTDHPTESPKENSSSQSSLGTEQKLPNENRNKGPTNLIDSADSSSQIATQPSSKIQGPPQSTTPREELNYATEARLRKVEEKLEKATNWQKVVYDEVIIAPKPREPKDYTQKLDSISNFLVKLYESVSRIESRSSQAHITLAHHYPNGSSPAP